MPARIAVEVVRTPAGEGGIDAMLDALGEGPGVYLGCDAGIAGMHPSGACLLVDPALILRIHEQAISVEPRSQLGLGLLRHPALAGLFEAVDAGAAAEGPLAAHIGGGPAREGAPAAPGPVAWLERFMAAFEPCADLTLIGAVGFEAHRLAEGEAEPRPGPELRRGLELGPDPDPEPGQGPEPGPGPESATSGSESVSGSSPASRSASASTALPHYGPSLGVLYLGETLYRRGSDGQWWRLQLSFPDLALPGPEAAAGGRPQDEDARAADTPARSAGTGSAARPPEPFAPPEWDDDFVPGGYARVVARAVQRLADATLVSLTLSQSFRRRVRMPPAQAFARLRAVNPAPVSFFVNTGDGECLFGASPDLQLRIAGRLVEAMPVCGTVARGAGAVGEAESFKALVNEEVDEASLAVCSDALRNDLAPWCEAGSLSLVDRRRQMSLSTVVHAVDRLRGRLRDGVSPWRAIFATAAPAMVTGTPRAAALRAIAELEAGPRRWYGGLMVQVAADGSALAGTILRAASIRNGHAEVRTGGDLLADSDPPREEQESRLKAVSLWRALGLAEQPGAASDGAPARAPRLESEAGAFTTDAVMLLDAGDAFAAAMADTLAGLGLSPAAAPRPASSMPAAGVSRLPMPAVAAVLIGGVPERVLDWRQRCEDAKQPVVAIGDAAAILLERAGFAVSRVAPEQGRLVRCIDSPQAPWPRTGVPWLAGRYAGSRVAAPLGEVPAGQAPPREVPAMPVGWQVWAVDSDGGLQAAGCADAGLACLLFRPDSLLSSEQAREALRAAIGFVRRAA